MKKIIKSFKMRPDIKVMFIGDHDTGKTCNLISYCTNSFTEENDIDLYENSNKNIKINSKDYSVYLRDVAVTFCNDNSSFNYYKKIKINVLSLDSF
jgi:GTPase SAR1 family protein